MRKGSLIIILSFLLCFLILEGKKGTCQEIKDGEMKYVPRVLFTINYGLADNQVGIIPEEEGVEGEIGGGPSRYFIVDFEKNVYIGDNVNGKIKVFDQNGRYLFSINSIGGFRIDKEKNIYVCEGITLDSARIKKYDSQGKFLYNIEYEPYRQKKGKMESAQIDSRVEVPNFEDSPLIDSAGRKYKVEYTADENLNVKEVRIEVQDKVWNSALGREIIGKPIGSFTLFSMIAPESIQSKRTSATTTGKVDIPDYKDLKYGLRVDYVDGEGNIYASGLASREKPLVLKKGLYINSDLIVYKYNSQGNFITQIRFPFTPNVVTGGSSVNYVIDSSGNIYCLQFHKDGMDVVKYEWKAVSKK